MTAFDHEESVSATGMTSRLIALAMHYRVGAQFQIGPYSMKVSRERLE